MIGGLAVYHHTKATENRVFPNTATIDVDLGISLGTDAGMKGTVQFDLQMLGYRENETGRLYQETSHGPLYLDFLTEHPPNTTGTRSVSNVAASVCPGINRALATREKLAVTGIDRFGDHRTFHIPFCGIGALLVLKLNAFAQRQNEKKAKDAYDILVAVSSYSKGAAAAVEAFHVEAEADNPAYALAAETLSNHFLEIQDEGPVLAHQFCYGKSADTNKEALLKTNLASIARALINA